MGSARIVTSGFATIVTTGSVRIVTILIVFPQPENKRHNTLWVANIKIFQYTANCQIFVRIIIIGHAVMRMANSFPFCLLLFSLSLLSFYKLVLCCWVLYRTERV